MFPAALPGASAGGVRRCNLTARFTPFGRGGFALDSNLDGSVCAHARTRFAGLVPRVTYTPAARTIACR